MINPLALWTQWLRVGQMVTETMAASNDVVARRSGTIAEAARDPFNADHGELTRMVTEKTSAFGRAGHSLAGDWIAMQSDLMRQSQAVGSIMLSGRMPSMAATGAVMDRGARIGQRAMASSARALRPIHATATANQKRLTRKRPA